ncbi:DUF676-domain-containing protein [Nadsonia fulvescens var. elongata DSM 6958]|uniref:DUF676-domain-containing protein n=1 Tax=Nadsonia fulvescens var. elongata DSM 6958 TaxID=857566 RepID=A0A1E3PQ55_9ASCO|nr:DUF676-domain-containing protein [Nadsonia fulvescens var. elongata DSM 6958]
MFVIRDILNELYGPDSDVNDVRVLVATSNSGLYTYDGIKLCGQRIIQEIGEAIESYSTEGIEFDRISFVGYSLGGLFARYAIGFLYTQGLFEKIQPISFTSFATPHIGTKAHGNTVKSNMFNSFAGNIIGQSGRDLFLDSSDIIYRLADPLLPYYQGLETFKYKILLANPVNDRTVPFYTAYISDRDPFQKLSFVNLEFAEINSSSDSPDPCEKFTNGEKVKLIDNIKSSHVKENVANPDNENLRASSIPFKATFMVVAPILAPIIIMGSAINTLVSNRRIILSDTEMPSDEKRMLLDIDSEIKSSNEPQISTTGASEFINNAVEEVLDHTAAAEKALQGRVNLEDAHQTIDENLILSDNTTPVDIEEIIEFSHPLEKVRTHNTFVESAPEKVELDSKAMEMINNLNKMNWEKYIPYVHTMHSHAEIVARRGTTRSPAGAAVVAFWADKVIRPKIIH